MRTLCLSCLLMLLYGFAPAQITFNLHSRVEDKNNSEAVLNAMYNTYHHKWCKGYRFSQKNTHYRNDSITGHSEWHESIEFPDKFCIHFGDTSQHKYVIFRNDSVYRYSDHKLLSARSDSSSLILLLGGMYFRSPEETMIRLRKAGYMLQKFSRQQWEKRPVYVIGADEGDLASNQVWIDERTLTVVRIIEPMKNGETMDMRFESHQKLGGGYVENKVSFRSNGHLEQVEEYYNIRPVKVFPKDEFRPKP